VTAVDVDRLRARLADWRPRYAVAVALLERLLAGILLEAREIAVIREHLAVWRVGYGASCSRIERLLLAAAAGTAADPACSLHGITNGISFG
jgi:hypothetical protein